MRGLTQMSKGQAITPRDREDGRCGQKDRPDWLQPHLLQNKDYKSGIEKTPDSLSFKPRHEAASEAQVPGQEVSVAGGSEGQVGAPGPVQDVQGVGQHLRVKALLRHLNLALLEGVCGGQGLLGRGKQS